MMYNTRFTVECMSVTGEECTLSSTVEEMRESGTVWGKRGDRYGGASVCGCRCVNDPLLTRVTAAKVDFDIEYFYD